MGSTQDETVRFPFNWDVPLPLRRHVDQVPGQQRALGHDGHLILLLHQVPAERWRRDVCLFWRSPEGVWMSTEQGEGATSLQRHVESYASAVQELETRAASLTSTRECHELRRELSPLQRAAHNMNSALDEARTLFPDDETLMNCFNLAANVRRATDLLVEDVRNTFEFAATMLAERQSRTSHRLSLLSATFFPTMTFATIFGMNLRSGLETLPIGIFWAMVAAGVACGLLVRQLITEDRLHNPWLKSEDVS